MQNLLINLKAILDKTNSYYINTEYHQGNHDEHNQHSFHYIPKFPLLQEQHREKLDALQKALDALFYQAILTWLGEAGDNLMLLRDNGHYMLTNKYNDHLVISAGDDTLIINLTLSGQY